MKLFYEPYNAYFGDCMPFYHDGTFYVFHQRDARNPRPFEPFEWSLATTKDFVHYEDKGVAIPKEGDDSPEQYILQEVCLKAITNFMQFIRPITGILPHREKMRRF